MHSAPSQAAAELGVGVPTELSVVGFDDSPAATLATPALTTVAQPHEEKGRVAAEWLLEAIERGRPLPAAATAHSPDRARRTADHRPGTRRVSNELDVVVIQTRERTEPPSLAEAFPSRAPVRRSTARSN